MFYPTAYVAFIDILGFSDLIEKSAEDRSLFEFLRSLLPELRESSGPLLRGLGLDGEVAAAADHALEITAFSDSIVISSTYEPGGAVLVPEIAALFAFRLLSRGILVRGAIERGSLYHEQGVVFGPALVNAVRAEQSVAIYPRVILLPEARRTFAKFAGPPLLTSLPRQDNDGQWFLHFLQPQFAALVNRYDYRRLGGDVAEYAYTDREEEVRAFGLVRDSLLKKLSREQRASIRPKLHWLATYFNSATAHVQEVEPIPLPE
ncbi:MAG: hypothetical protein M5U32_02355 [Myxococcota bacterium]|nr:hypothetical protein [Myxococcota bacterium]